MTLTRLRAALLAVLFGLVSTMPAWAEIKDWSTTAGSNATITDSTYGNIGFAEGQAPSTLNDSARALMAHVRAWYQGGGWTNLGYTHTYASATSVTVAGTDVTAQYPAGRRVKAVGSTTGTIYGRVSSSSFSTNTTINFQWDSGSLSSETLAVSVGFFNSTGSPSPSDLAGALNLAKGANVASAASPSTTDIWAPAGNLVHVTGTNSMGSFGTAPQAGASRIVVFDGAATLIHSASGIVLPCSTNITTAANDIALVIADTTAKHLVVYFKADGTGACTSSTVPTRQVFLSGSGTYTTPALVRWIEVEAKGSGGGGGGSGDGNGGNGGAGGDTTFGTLTASGGAAGGGGISSTTGALGGLGGAATNGDLNIPGGGGSASGGTGANANPGGQGGGAGGGRGGNGTNAGTAGATNSGGGGGGGGQGSGTAPSAGAGGGEGGYVRKIIGTPSSTYSYAVGAAGTAGAAGTGGSLGGAGALGYVIVTEHY